MGRKRCPLEWAAVKQSTQSKGWRGECSHRDHARAWILPVYIVFLQSQELLSCKEMKWYSRIIQDPFIEKNKASSQGLPECREKARSLWMSLSDATVSGPSHLSSLDFIMCAFPVFHSQFARTFVHRWPPWQIIHLNYVGKRGYVIPWPL